MVAEKKSESRKKSEANLIPFVKGKSGNPSGKPKGQRNYATIYREALKKIGAQDGMTAEEIEEAIEMAGLRKAIEGDFNFQKDIKDRLHGKPVQTVNNVETSLEDIVNQQG